MKYNIRCKECGVELTFKNIFTEKDINHKTLRCCKDCGETVLERLKNERLVEVYNGRPIYEFEGKFVPYWGCNYYFNTIEECRDRMDNPNIAIVPLGLLGAVMREEL